MKLPIYQIDAFASAVFRGNPAAVCPLEHWLSDDVMQSIAAENNLAETAFFVANDDGTYQLRWFTPEIEIPLCGHATLASAYVLFMYLGYSKDVLRFQSKSGELRVQKAGDKLVLDFPARPLHALSPEAEVPLMAFLTPVLGKQPAQILHSVNNYLAIYETEEDVRTMNPNFFKLNELPDVIGVIVTAQSTNYDFVSRYFCPNAGIPEDPVTGSAHCTLIPYWAEKLSKTSLHAYQASKRGGELWCELQANTSGNRVLMSGEAKPYLQGFIEIP